MKKESLAGMSLAAMFGIGQAAFGQAVPGVPAAAAPGVAAAPAAAGAAAPRNIFSMFCMTPEQKAACKEKICRSAAGQLLNNMITPASAFTGGVIKPLCPPVLPSDLLKPADSAEGAAAKIKADEAAAKARRAATRYLGTVDCRYWPEATEALINALRADRNECVRLEAALSLGRGCCCNKATIKALTISINCTDEDGNPPEASPRVREAAAAALYNCLECYTERLKASDELPIKELPVPRVEETPISPKIEKPVDPIIEGKKDGKEEKKDGKPVARRKQADEELTPALYYKRVNKMDWEKVIEPAKKALSRQVTLSQANPARPAGRSLSEIVARSMAQPAPATAPPPAAVPLPVAVTPAQPAAVGIAPSLFPSMFRKAPSAPAPVSVPVTVPATAPRTQPQVRITPVTPDGPLTAGATGTVTIAVKGEEPPREPVKVSNGVVEVTPPAAAPVQTPPLGQTERMLPPLPGETPMPAAVTPAVVPATVTPEATPAVVPAVVTPATVAPAAQTSFVPPADPVPAPREEPKVSFVTPTMPSVTATPVVQTTYAPAVHIVPHRPVVAATEQAYSTEALIAAFHETGDLQRKEWVIQQLGRLPNGAADHRVVSLLIQTAEGDGSALVRLASLESIARLNVSHGKLPALLTRLEGDGDVRVRMAARDLSARR